MIHYPISCHWSLSIPPENIRKSDVFRRYRKRPMAWNRLRSNWQTRILNKRMFRIYRASKYAVVNMLQLNMLYKMLHVRYSVGFWICLFLRMYQSGEYNRVLDISVLHKNLNKIFHDRCLTVLWICLWFWISQGFKYAKVTHDSE